MHTNGKENSRKRSVKRGDKPGSLVCVVTSALLLASVVVIFLCAVVHFAIKLLKLLTNKCAHVAEALFPNLHAQFYNQRAVATLHRQQVPAVARETSGKCCRTMLTQLV